MTDANTNNDIDEKKPMKDELNEADAVNAEVDLDDSKAKFLNGGKGMDDDAHVVVEVASAESADVSFTGLGKDELMQYVNDPFWKRLRIILFVLFWVGWLAMLVAAIVIIVLAPRCPYRPDLKWYHKESAYRVYPKSFQDSNGDGVGDLKGVKSRVSYATKDLGAKVLSFGSIYKKDSGNGIIDHKDVDPMLGSVEDIKGMLSEFRKTGTKIILDFVPNHTSKNHTWFMESKKTKDNKYAKYYVWADPATGGGPPNNWKNEHGISAWTLDAGRNQYYLAQKGPEYPDLNLEDEDVKNEMEGILRFWLDMGIGGFNLVDLKYLAENVNLTAETTPESQTVHYAGSIPVVSFFRKILDQYSDKPGRERVLMGVVEDATVNQTLAYYGTGDMPGLHIVIDGKVSSSLRRDCDATCVKDMVDAELAGVAEPMSKWLGWMVGNEDTSRISERMGDHQELSTLVMQLMLPGTPVMYYGDEIGMKDGTFTSDSISDVSTDRQELDKMKFRTPMQWNVSANAGFTSGTPWLPVNSNFRDNNVASENAHYRKGSVYKKVVQLLKIRSGEESESIQFGKTTTDIVAGDLFWFTRQAVGFPGYLVAINFGSGGVTHRFAGPLFSTTATVVFHSAQETNNEMLDIASTYIELQSGESIILKMDV